LLANYCKGSGRRRADTISGMADLRELTTRLIDEVWNAAFDDGKVVAVWSVNELFTVLQQLGVEVTPPD
jgi:hypothetical protein